MKVFNIQDKSRGQVICTDEDNFITLIPGGRYNVMLSGTFVSASAANIKAPQAPTITAEGFTYDESDGTNAQNFECTVPPSGYIHVNLVDGAGSETMKFDFAHIPA